ncbi:hypothetical protein PNEG_02467 [Pneumocystis murina B123]|uniref:DNA/RNA-binding protein Alba-like domain-containing protein n=1 Tax=Pneumocystis murina (strain B123) TaxID=1069680 RepID=M7PF85_PNEMU|nr:hypothetical protein PNEG_02467 [Pneumocystis murina B123]EMR09124.1 hypothetical protein PNEG_02467 [Pneumocystis murina B123]
MSQKDMQTQSPSTIKTNNKVYVKKSSKIRSIVSRGLYVLTEQEFENTFTIEAQGLSIGKAVTIIEILKRRLRDAELPFWQYNQLDNINVSVPHTASMTSKEYFQSLLVFYVSKMFLDVFWTWKLDVQKIV